MWGIIGMGESHRENGGKSSKRPSPPTGRVNPDRIELAILGFGGMAACFGLISLTSAILGIWNKIVVISLALICGYFTLFPFKSSWQYSRGLNKRFLTGLGLLLVVAGLLTFPGYRVGMAGWDPGVYVMHARSIVESGHIDASNPMQNVNVDSSSIRMSFPGLVQSSAEPDRLSFGFFHLYSALAAVGYSLARSAGVALVNPILGLLGVAATTACVRRLTSSRVALVAGSFLAVSMIWVWHSRLPTSEVPTAALFGVGLLAAVVALDTGQSRFAVFAAFMTGVAATARADGLLILVIILGAIALSLWTARSGIAVSLGVGAVPGFVLWAVQAYGSARDYADVHNVPSLLTVALASIAAVVVGIALNRVEGSRFALLEFIGRQQSIIIKTIVVGYSIVLIGLVLRAVMAPDPSTAISDTFAPYAIVRLALFLTPAGIALFLAGILSLWRTYMPRILILIGPGMMIALLYFNNPRIHSRLIWWTRRFVPLVWIPVVCVMALGCVWLSGRLSSKLRLTGVGRDALTLALGLSFLVPQAQWAVGLHGHQELAGSLHFSAQVADLLPENPIVFWVRGEAFSAFAAPVMVHGGVDLLPIDSDITDDDWNDIWGQVDLSRPIVIVVDNGVLPGFGDSVYVPFGSIIESYPFLAFEYHKIPARVASLHFGVDIYEVLPCLEGDLEGQREGRDVGLCV